MSYDLLQQAYEVEGLRLANKAVLCYMAYRSKQQAFPSTATIAKATGMSRRAVFISLSELEKLGFLERAQGQSGKQTIRYNVTIPTYERAAYASPAYAGDAQGICTTFTSPMQEMHMPYAGDAPNKQEIDKGKTMDKQTNDLFGAPLEVAMNGSSKPKKKQSLPHPGFDEFWAIYPRKEDKQDALEAWNRVKPDLEKVKKALSWQKETWNGRKFTKLPATYLNKGTFNDEQPYEEPTFH